MVRMGRKVIREGTIEAVYVDGELVSIIDRDPIHKLDLGAIVLDPAIPNPYVKLFLEDGMKI